MFIKERHENLRGGNGIVITHTKVIFFRERRIKIIIMEMSPNSTIGLHQHVDDTEIYITNNKNVRFGIKKNKFFNRCPKGGTHSASNLSNEGATVFAIKF